MSEEVKNEVAPAAPAADAAAPAAEGEAKAKKSGKSIPAGIAFIRSTFNNTQVSIADARGGVISWSSAGKAGFKGSRKSTAFAATMVAQDAARVAVAKGMHECEVRMQGAGAGRESAVRAIRSPQRLPCPQAQEGLIMGRYTGPVCRQCRREGRKLFLKGARCYMAKCPIEQGTGAPGMHVGRRAKKMSEYGTQLRQKQSLRRQYGMGELQFHRFFEEALRREGITGEILLQMLEMRLDNIVYRLGLAPSRRAARQFVLHGHILVNDRKAAVPSMVVKVGDFISVKDTAKSKDAANRSVEAATGAQLPVWMQFDRANLRAEVLAVPTREQIAPIVDEQAIVELYSR